MERTLSPVSSVTQLPQKYTYAPYSHQQPRYEEKPIVEYKDYGVQVGGDVVEEESNVLKEFKKSILSESTKEREKRDRLFHL